MAILRSISEAKEFRLRKERTVLGRDPDCDITIDSGQVSRHHAIVVKVDGNYYVEDLSSLNGTYLNGELIRERTLLKSKDRIAIFDLIVEFQVEDAKNKPPSTLLLVDENGSMIEDHSVDEPSFMATRSATDLRLEVEPEAKLRAFLEISEKMSNTLDLQEVLPKILEGLFSIFPQADRGYILLRDPQTGRLVTKARHQRRQKDDSSISLSKTVLEHVMSTGQAVVTADARGDDRFDHSKSLARFSIRSLMCVPMISQSQEILGIIHTDSSDSRHPFREEDLDMMVCASTQAARAVELSTLHEELRDLEAATRIQKGFLPGMSPKIPSLRFFDFYESARRVGGDYYDYIPLPGDRLAVAIGDVAGKGVSAALLMARLSAAVRFRLATEPSVSAAVNKLNEDLTQASDEVRFVTFVVLVIDLVDFRVTLVNAGHILPILRRSGEPKVVELGQEIAGMPLGVMPNDYQQQEIALDPGDVIVLCTDGVTESRNPDGGFYDSERLCSIVGSAPQDVSELGRTILEDVRKFSAGCPQSDDLALVCFGRTRGMKAEG